WRVGGIIQGETPDDGEVQVSEPEVDETPATFEIDRTDDAMDLAGLHDEEDIFAEPGELDVATDGEALDVFDATDEEG
ncbi:MAG: hypothetical protein QF464_07160, partial [Myxococcota bacterium]|nr:hypothetical protein [Myxococcota bacterium]